MTGFIRTDDGQFNFALGDKELRAISINGEPYFVGQDVAKSLEYSNERNALNKFVAKDFKTMALISGGGKKRRMTVISEVGLYELIFRSKMKEAETFKLWVFKEVLPQIRKTGGYLPIDLDATKEEEYKKHISVLEKTEKLREEQLVAIEGKLEEVTTAYTTLTIEVDNFNEVARPFFALANVHMDNEDLRTTTDIANTLLSIGVQSVGGIKVGRNSISDILVKLGYIKKVAKTTKAGTYREPTQSSIENDFVRVVHFKDEAKSVNIKFTPKGLRSVIQKATRLAESEGTVTAVDNNIPKLIVPLRLF